MGKYIIQLISDLIFKKKSLNKAALNNKKKNANKNRRNKWGFPVVPR